MLFNIWHNKQYFFNKKKSWIAKFMKTQRQCEKLFFILFLVKKKVKTIVLTYPNNILNLHRSRQWIASNNWKSTSKENERTEPTKQKDTRQISYWMFIIRRKWFTSLGAGIHQHYSIPIDCGIRCTRWPIHLGGDGKPAEDIFENLFG